MKKDSPITAPKAIVISIAAAFDSDDVSCGEASLAADILIQLLTLLTGRLSDS